MQLSERAKQDVRVHRPSGLHEDVYRWQAGVPIRAAIYPMTDAHDARRFGEDPIRRALLLYDGEEALAPGMGISTDGASPAWRIERVERWAHTRAELCWIPRERRGSTDDDVAV